MPTQAVRLSICRNPQEVANAVARDQTLGFTHVGNSVTQVTDVGLIVQIPVRGEINDLFVQIDANAQPPPPLTVVISNK